MATLLWYWIPPEAAGKLDYSCHPSLIELPIDALGPNTVGIYKLKIEILRKLFLLSECDCDDIVRLQISTFHDCWAVMTCAKLWPDWVIIFHENHIESLKNLDYGLITLCEICPWPQGIVNFFKTWRELNCFDEKKHEMKGEYLYVN